MKEKVANDDTCFECGVVRHWKRNCPTYFARHLILVVELTYVIRCRGAERRVEQKEVLGIEVLPPTFWLFTRNLCFEGKYQEGRSIEVCELSFWEQLLCVGELRPMVAYRGPTPINLSRQLHERNLSKIEIGGLGLLWQCLGREAMAPYCIPQFKWITNTGRTKLIYS
ncbi:unnamed protein product [Lactuca virosa]|uniref:CCHC-type domain-containing protein n=1 Tax=Lactuca virosa TaxID=75947 RepID=A0AAU9M3F6_9ASTR|nr:unnamed protein product [Lactuca virosa]